MDKTQVLAREAKTLLSAASSNEDKIREASAITMKIRQQIHEAPYSGATLGPLLGRLKAYASSTRNSELCLPFVKVLSGRLAVGHRPKVKLLSEMKRMGVTHILTLLSPKEGAEALGAAIKKQGIKWLWLPLQSAAPPDASYRETVERLFDKCEAQLQQSATIYIHCSAGIHRTGMVAYALLRHMGLPADEALKLLGIMRQLTGEGVGTHRLDWGKSYARTFDHGSS